MSKVLITLLSGFLGLASIAYGHDIKYTLIQDGATQVASCSGSDLGVAQIELFKTKGSTSEGYILLSTSDEDSGQQYEHLIKTNVTTKGDDAEVFAGEEASAQIATVGEGTVPLTIKLNAGSSALKVWLKAYADGFKLRKASFNCNLL